MGRNRALGSPFEIANVATSVTTEWNIDMYAVDATLGTPVSVTLDPNAFNGDQVVVQDVGNNAGAQPISVLASAGQTILNGFGATLSISTDGAGVLLTFDHALAGWVPQITGAGGGGGGSTAGYVIYRPGVPSAGTAVETWPEVQSALANGAITVYVDSSHAAGGIAHVPGSSGVTDFTGVTLAAYTTSVVVANPGGYLDILQIDDGATLHRVKQITGYLTVQLDSRTVVGLTFNTTLGQQDTLLLFGSALLMTTTATLPGILVSAGGAFDIQAWLAVIGQPGAVALLDVAATGTITFGLYDSTTIDPDTVVGSGSTTSLFGHDSSVPFVTFTGFAGTQQDNRDDLAQWAQPSAGTTGQTPVAPNLKTGQMYFDTSVGAATWWNGSSWAPDAAPLNTIPSWTVAAWFISPTAGNDTNNGTSAGTPLRTWRELVRRWGTISPVLAQSTVITFLGTGHSDNTDPVIFRPILDGPVAITIKGTLTQVWSGVLAGTVPRNRATPQLLQETLPAGAAIQQLVINTTHPSRAWVFAATGGNWLMSQPLTSLTIPWSVFSVTEVNTWTNNDVVSGNTMTAINFAIIEPTKIHEAAAVYITTCVGFDPFPGTFTPMNLNVDVFFSECLMQRFLLIGGTTEDGFTGSNNSWFVLAAASCTTPAFSPWYFFFGGVIGPSNLPAGTGFGYDADVILTAGFAENAGADSSTTYFGLVYCDTNVGLQVDGVAVFTSNFSLGGPIVWGPNGQVVSYNGGRIFYPVVGGGAVATFQQKAATPFLINKSATANSVLSGTPDVLNGGISLTPGHLDASPAGIAAFNGNAFILGGGSIANTGFPAS